MGQEPILPVRRPITIGTIIKLDGDGVGIGDRVEMCKQTLTSDGDGVGTCKQTKQSIIQLFLTSFYLILIFSNLEMPTF